MLRQFVVSASRTPAAVGPDALIAPAGSGIPAFPPDGKKVASVESFTEIKTDAAPTITFLTEYGMLIFHLVSY
jgi:hypothetical protein